MRIKVTKRANRRLLVLQTFFLGTLDETARLVDDAFQSMILNKNFSASSSLFYCGFGMIVCPFNNPFDLQRSFLRIPASIDIEGAVPKQLLGERQIVNDEQAASCGGFENST